MTIKLDEKLAPADLADEADVEEWFRRLVERGINFHPEETFEEMVNLKTGARTFSRKDARRLDELMDRANEICEPSAVALRVFAQR
jgi:hypothetical protein